VKTKKVKTTKNTDAATPLATKTKEAKTSKAAEKAPAKTKATNGQQAKATESKETPSEVKDAKAAPVKSKTVKGVLSGVAAQMAPTKSKKAKTTPAADEDTAVAATISKPTATKAVNGDKKSKKEGKKIAVNVPEPEDSSSDGEDNIADQTAALLAGFDSSSDEDEDDAVPLDQVPQANISKKARKALEAAKNDTPGTIYVG
jgi:nucleolar protein 15